ncbi:MAG: right-handed parallel beta-helix repeat-containing protein, partial [Chloroflexi bacterium]|nr:right-handed parallel beta-helix repeat-containing protein [Chloroflexota bacterium]
MPIASALGLAFSLLWLLAAVTRPAQATPSEIPQPATSATIRYVIGPGGDDSRDCQDRSYPCATIQRAIDVASSGDTIAVAQGNYTALNRKAGLSQVVYVDKPVTVEGSYGSGFFGSPNFSTPSVINPANGGRGIVITGTAAVTVRGFRVNNGNGAAAGLNGNGGALLVGGGATVRLDQMTLTGNRAAQGGALYVGRGQVYLTNSTLTSNSATADGGALLVASSGAVTLDNTPLSDNRATGKGGSIYASGGTVIFNGSQISDNSAGGDGGAAYADGGSLHFGVGALLKENHTTTGQGSSLFVLNATAIFTGATVSNHLGNANAIYAQDSDLRFATGSSLFNNRVLTGNGGALYASGGSVRLDGMTVISNSTDVGDGGALYVVTGSLTIVNSGLSQNLAFANGGAIAVMTGTLSVTGGALTQNRASAHGGALYVVGSTATLSPATLDSNKAGLNGGAAYMRDSVVNMNGGSISANTAMNGSGGGFFVEGGAIGLAQSTRVTDNQAGLAAELALSADVSPRDPRPLQPVAFDISLQNNGPQPTSNVQARNVLPNQLIYLSHTANGGTFDPATGIFSVTALANGGSAKLTINAIPSQEGTFTDTVEILRQDLYDPITTNNGDSARVTVSNSAQRQAAQGQRAGASSGSGTTPLAGYVLDSVYALLQNSGYLTPAPDDLSTRTGARAAATLSANGGGLAVYNGTVTLTDVTLDKNQAVFDGGGLYASDSQALVTGNNTFSGNGSSFGSGGGMSAIGGTATVQNGVFQSNRAVNGGGLYASAGLSVTVAASTFSENSATSSGGGLYVLGQASHLQGNTISKNVAGQGGGLLVGSTQAVVADNTIDQNRSSLATTVAKGRAVGVGAGGYFIGTDDLNFSGNRVTNNTIPYETITRLLAIVEDRVVIEGTDPPTIIEPGPQFETKAHMDNGGGLYMQEVTGTLTANIVSGNSASGDGGGFYIVGGKLAMINDLIVQNRIGISITLGSAILISGTDLSLIHTTIADNQHQNLDGDGRNTAVSIFGKGSKLTMLNSIVANHEVGVEGDPANKVDGTNNVWWNNSIRHWGKDLFGDFSIHLFGDPQFVDPASGDYHIKRTSAAFDAGVATAADFGWNGIATDLAGEPRLRAFAVDAGAYEQRYANGLYLTQQPSERIVADGLSFTYVISIANHSPAAVADVALQDLLPGDPSASLTASSIASSRGVCNLAALSCGLGAIGPEEVVAVTLLVQARGAPPPHSMLKMVNHVTLSAPGLDPTQSDTASDDTTFLQLMYTGGAAVARAGDVVHTSACRVNLLSEVYDDGLPHPNGKDYTTLQAAVNASARKADVIRVSGYCGVSTVNLQVKLTIQGGWSTDMTVLDPVAYPTTLDAANAGPVLRITEQTAPTVENLELINGSAPSGGCVYIKQSSVTLRNIQMRNCSAIGKGGGLFVDRFSKPVLLDSLIENSSANAAGAGIYIKESGAEIKNTIIRNNTGAADGGGIYLKKSDATVSGSTISGHTVTADGGGIYLDASAATIQNNTIRGNLASWAGGGIFADNSPATISFNRIENNAAEGIPIYVDLFLFKIDISGGGGGIYGRKSDMRITNNQIIGNRAPVVTGAGIHLWNGSQPQIDGNVVAKNTGNGIFLRLTPPVFKFYILIPPLQPPPFDPTLIFPLPKPAPIRMRHNTIHANTAGGVVIFGRTAIEMTDNIISANGKGVVGVSDFYLHIIFIMYSVPFVPIPIPIPIP